MSNSLDPKDYTDVKKMKQEDAMRKIKAIFALAAGALTQEEAIAAASRAQMLMDRYKIDQAQLDAALFDVPKGPGIISVTVENKAGEYGKWGILDWKLRLIYLVADVNGVMGVKMARRVIQLFGRPEQIQLTEYLAQYLCRELERLSFEAFDDAQSGRGAFRTNLAQKTYVQHFGIAAANAVHRRMLEARKTQDTGEQVTALMVIDKEAIKAFISQEIGRTKTTKARRRPNEASVAGYKAGNDIQWRAGLEGASQADAPVAKRIGGR